MIRQTIIISALTLISAITSEVSAQYYRDPLNPAKFQIQERLRLPGEKRLADAEDEIHTSTINVPGFFIQRRRDRSLFLNPDFGVLAGITRANDLASYSIRRNSMFKVKSRYVDELIRLPVDQFPNANSAEAPWSIEEVKSALEDRSIAGSILKTNDWRFDRRAAREQENRQQADALRAKGLEIFRSVLDRENAQLDVSERLGLYSLATEKFLASRRLQPDDPSNYLALCVVEREKENLFTALVYLTQGLSRLNSLEDLQIRREDFFPDERDWIRRLDEVNVLANNSNEPEPYLMLALYAYLNGDRILAKTSTEKALERYIKRAESPSVSALESLEFEQRIERTRQFLDLIKSNAQDKNATSE